MKSPVHLLVFVGPWPAATSMHLFAPGDGLPVSNAWHLVDVIRVGIERFWTLTLDPGAPFAAWDENDLAAARNYAASSPIAAVEAFRAATGEWVLAAKATPPEATATHPVLGVLSGADVVRRNAHEVEHHLADIAGTIETGAEGPGPMVDAAPAHRAQPTGDLLVGGMDGARSGWVLVTTRLDGTGGSTVSVVADLAAVMARIDNGELSALAVDIPIGLPESDPRSCDVEARKLIGGRRNSVFPAPLRSSLGSETYEEACERSRSASGKAMSRQAFAILPKVESVDRIMTPERQTTVVEVHPEVCFTVLAGHAMSHHKSKAEGRAERLEVLRPVFPDLDEHVTRRLPGTDPDDVVDAFVAAWSARRWLGGTYRRLGGDVDKRGLRMEMIA